MGVKLAVVGGGSTYTPELIEGIARRADRLPVDELVLLDIDPERLEIVGGLAGRMLDRLGWPGRLDAHRRHRRRHRRRELRPHPAARRRSGRAPRRRDAPAEVRHDRPGDDRRRAGSRRPCGPCPSSSTSPSESGERAARRGVDRRLHEPGRDRRPRRCSTKATGRSGCATSRSASSASSRSATASSPSRSSSSTSGSTTCRGTARSASTASIGCPRCSTGDGAAEIAE